MGVRYEDLPAVLKRQVDESGAVPKARKRDRKGAGKTATTGSCECGEPFTSTTKWEKHSDAEGRGHKRFVLVDAVCRCGLPGCPECGEDVHPADRHLSRRGAGGVPEGEQP